jgi:Rrf2 family protein
MFGKTTEYAIRALVYIYLRNVDGNKPGFREIAAQIDAPAEFTGKVVQKLVRLNLIASLKGRGGGFFFTDMQTPLTLMEVVKVFEGDGFFSKCGFGLSVCSKKDPCPIHDDYAPVRKQFRKIASESSIQMLALRIKDNNAVLNRS